MVEKIIHSIEFSNQYENITEKKTETIETIKSTQAIFIDIADSFIEYIRYWIQELDDDLKSNGWGVTYLLQVENAYELLTVFQIFDYFNGRFPLTNALLIVLDGEMPEGKEERNLKQFYEMFKDTNSHGLVSL